MSRLRSLTNRQVVVAAAAGVAVFASLGAAGAALSADGPTPPAKPLDHAIRDATSGPRVDGITARVAFKNELLPAGSLPEGAASPILSGATGRVWLAGDGRMRLELQSQAGDAQVVVDDKQATIYDAASNTVYRARLGGEQAERRGKRADGPPSLADIRGALARLGKSADVSAPDPGSIAGQPAYTVRVAPRRDGGLLGRVEMAFDAVRGVPLRAAVYAGGQDAPVLELAATEISYGQVAAADLTATPPAGARVVELDSAAGKERAKGRGEHRRDRAAGKDRAKRRGEHRRTSVKGIRAVQKRLTFGLAAPAELVGLPRQSVRLLEQDGKEGAMVMYGEGLGALAVVQQPAGAEKPAAALRGLPRVSVDGATGTELATALGTVLTFEQGGVRHVLVGSLPAAAAEAAARELR